MTKQEQRDIDSAINNLKMARQYLLGVYETNLDKEYLHYAYLLAHRLAEALEKPEIKVASRAEEFDQANAKRRD